MKYIYILTLLYLVPMVFAEDTILNPIFDSEYIINYGISEECRNQYSQFMEFQPEELIAQYCSTVYIRSVILLGIVFIYWLIEPIIKKKLEDTEYAWIIFTGKWIGLGLLFIAGYVIISMGI